MVWNGRAAGHPPLLCWRAADRILGRIESNGQLFGVPFDGDYPVCEIPVATGYRLLVYTDGVSEPENAAGEALDDHRLEQLLRDNRSRPAAARPEREGTSPATRCRAPLC